LTSSTEDLTLLFKAEVNLALAASAELRKWRKEQNLNHFKLKNHIHELQKEENHKNYDDFNDPQSSWLKKAQQFLHSLDYQVHKSF